MRFSQHIEDTHGSDVVPDCNHASLACGHALEQMGHKVELVMGSATLPETNEEGLHWWLNVDGKRFDPKAEILKHKYGQKKGYTRYQEEWKPTRSEWDEVTTQDYAKDSEEMFKKSEESAKKRKVVASVAVFNPEGKMLWGKRNDTGKWTLTGGHLNAGELPVKGAVRELFEEAGLIPDELHDLGSDEVDSYDGKHKIKVHAFKAICGGKPHSKNDPDKECDEWHWVDVTNNKVPNEILNNLHSPKNVTLKLLGMQDWDELGKSERSSKEWAYHTTVDDNLDSIATHGLRPVQGSVGAKSSPLLFFTHLPQHAYRYFIDRQNPLLLRFPMPSHKNCGGIDGKECTISHPVHPQGIEVFVGDDLNEMADIYWEGDVEDRHNAFDSLDTNKLRAKMQDSSKWKPLSSVVEEAFVKSEEEQLEKNIGFLTFPKLGVHQLPTMPYTGGSPKAEMIHFGEDAGTAKGQMRATFVRGDSTPEEYRKMHGYVKGGALTMPRGTQADLQMHGTTAHEGQHSAFMRVGQIHSPVRQRMLTRFLHDQLNPQEQDALQKIASRSGYVRPPEGKRFAEYDYYEEALASLQNYLQDSNFRNAVHTDLMKPAAANDTHHGKIFADNDPIVAKYPHLLSQRKLHDSAKSAWRKLMSIAPHVEYSGGQMVVNPTVNKSEEELVKGRQVEFPFVSPKPPLISVKASPLQNKPVSFHNGAHLDLFDRGEHVGTVQLMGDYRDPTHVDLHYVGVDKPVREQGYGHHVLSALKRYINRTYPAVTHATSDVTSGGMLKLINKVYGEPVHQHNGIREVNHDEAMSTLSQRSPENEHGVVETGNYITTTHWIGKGKRKELNKSEDLNKMAIADLQTGKKVNESGTSSRYDYTHMVPESEKDGYEMVVVHRKNPTTNVPHLQTYLYHNKRAVGEVKGFVDGNEIELHSDLKPEHQGKRLGNAMYNAILAHANSLGIQGVKGHRLTAAGHRANESISREHGLDYKPEVIGAVTTEAGPTPTLYRHGGYTIKSEEELEKGSRQSKTPFNPQTQDRSGLGDLHDWQMGWLQDRNTIPQMEGDALSRALHKLHGATKARRGPTGEREFLLWRGHGPELDVSGSHVNLPERSSWTADPSIATGYARRGHLTGVWVPEKAIVSVPKQLGQLRASPYAQPDKNGQITPKGSNEMSPEYEVIVAPSKLEIAKVMPGEAVRNIPIGQLTTEHLLGKAEELTEVLNRIENIFSLLKSDKIHSTSDATVMDIHRAPQQHLSPDHYRITPQVEAKYEQYGRGAAVKNAQYISDPEPSIGGGVVTGYDNPNDLHNYIRNTYEPFLTSKILPQSHDKPVVFLAPVPIRSMHHGNHSPYISLDHLHGVAVATDKRGRVPFYYTVSKKNIEEGHGHPLLAPLITKYENKPNDHHVISVVDGNGRSVSARTAGATHMLAYVQMKHEDIPHFLKMIHDTANNPEGHVRTIMNAPNLPSEFHIHQIPTLLDNVQKSEIIDRFDKLLKSLI